MSEETQALCFLAGANSIFCGPKLLTTPNPARDRDMALLGKLGLRPMDTGPLGMARWLEGTALVMIGLSRHGAGSFNFTLGVNTSA